MQDDSDEVVSFEDAAAECGMTLDEFFTHLVVIGDLVPAGDENYTVSDRALSEGTMVAIGPSIPAGPRVLRARVE